LRDFIEEVNSMAEVRKLSEKEGKTFALIQEKKVVLLSGLDPIQKGSLGRLVSRNLVKIVKDHRLKQKVVVLIEETPEEEKEDVTPEETPDPVQNAIQSPVDNFLKKITDVE
jgi:hypothetical protein